ncbi:uncharacterized protein taf1c isoform X2 [Salminus brasiliensis]|uniref:uncharacterized protein taf1c isoform X2 n=1 Tax=Salminus brasiliensis TaxID=930266 RepID=UPI003B83982A
MPGLVSAGASPPIRVDHMDKMDKMDNRDNSFPAQLFPHFYLDGPPELEPKHNFDGWGSYGQILRGHADLAQCGTEGATLLGFKGQHKMEGELWIPVEPVVTPLLPHNSARKIPSGPPFSPDDFPEHMKHFYVHHCMDSFSTMGRLLGEHFNFRKDRSRKDCVSMGRMKNLVRRLKYKKCEFEHASEYVHRYRRLLEDVICDVPPGLLAELLHEELTFQREQEQFSPDTTGGALGCVPLEDFRGQREACLIYPRGEALDSLNFHRVVLEFSEGKPSVDVSNEPLVYNLNGAVRQISAARVDDAAQVGVRSDYFCAAWAIKDGQRPRPLEVIQLKKRCTSLNVRMQKVREEKSNLYFNGKSAWRWCEFSAHPRVMVFADRTGAELTDSRSSDCSHTLFRIGKTAGCKSGERVIVSKYMGEVHAYHHLITTQFSAYVLDERMPSIPALKWEHMMESPPCFAQVLPALGSSTTSKILLGARGAQETVLLQYSGGREQPCQSDSPVQKLCSPCESLKLQLLPHERHKAEKRLAVPAAGLTATQSDDFLAVFQLTEAGDVFSQMLKLHSDSSGSRPDPSAPSRNVDSAESPSILNSSQQAQASVPEEEPAEEPQQDGRRQGTSAPSDEEQLSDSDFERELRQRMLSQVEVVVNDVQDGPHASDTEEPASVPVPSIRGARPVRPACPETPSEELTLTWSRWLESLLAETLAKKRSLRHRKLETSDVMQFKGHCKDRLEEDKFQSLRTSLTDALKSKKLLVHGGTCLPALDITPVPGTVDASDWQDDLSQRLSASWAGGWRSWWEEKLGLNRDSKIQALRRRRRQEKRARARTRVALSGSFTSSVSYQDSLSGWSSATSQCLGSDSESFPNSQSAAEDGPLSEPETLPRSPVVQRVPESQAAEGSLPVVPSPREELGTCKRLEHVSPSQTQQDLPGKTSTVEAGSTSSPLMLLKQELSNQLKPSLQQQRRQQQQDYLSSLFSSQEPSQDPGEVNDDTPLVSSGVAPLQRSRITLASQRPSQLRPASQASQASQPQRKKSRMGF